MITLTKQATTPSDSDTTTVWAMTVTAEVTDSDLPPEIFVYHCGVVGDAESDVFECVASPIQIEQLPDARPTGDALLIQPYYRLATATIFCANAQQAADVWEELKLEADILAEEWARAVDLSETETYSTP